MKKSFSKSAIIGCTFSVLLFTSCEQDEKRLTPQDSADITGEAVVDALFQDLDDLAGVVIQSPNEAEYSGGRVAGTITIQDNRFTCDGVVVTIEPDEGSTAENPSGVITVDFGTAGCADLRGNVRKGKLIFAYDGKRFLPGSTVVTTTDNYSINGVKLEGTRTSTNISGSTDDAPKFHSVLLNGKATFEDGTYALRQSDIYWSWIRGANPAQDKFIIHMNSTASGLTRGGRNYSVSLLKQLEYQRLCPMAVSGTKKLVVDQTREIIIDYGVGTCDSTITITVDGVTRTISVG
jgi:hypothetical protein